MQSKKAKNAVKKVTAATLAVPLAVSSLAAPGLGAINEAQAAVEESGVPSKIVNPTIDWDTFSHEAISLVWDANPDADGYIVERNGVEVYRGAENRFDDTGLASGATYQYAIYAYNESGLSVPNIDYIQTDFVYQTIVLNWLPVEDAFEFLIERNGQIIGTTPGDVYTFSDTEALVGNKYRYRVIPVTETGELGEPFEWEEQEPNPGDIVILEPPNQAPTSSVIPEIELTVEQEKSLNLDDYFSDPNGDELAYRVEAADPLIAEAYATGATGKNLQVIGKSLGDTNLLITAMDGKGGTVQRQVRVRVVEPAVAPPTDGGTDNPQPLPNVAPEIRTIPNRTILVHETDQLNLNNYFNDEDGDELFYTIHVNNERVMATEENSSLRLEGLEKGESTVTVYADDGFGHVVNQSFKVTVIDPSDEPEPEEPEVPEEKEDRPPVAGGISDYIIDLGETITPDIGAALYDPDGDYVTYTVETNVDGIISHSIKGSDRQAELVVTGTQVGQTKVTVTVTDDFGNSASSSFVVKVEEPFVVTPGDGDGGEPTEPQAPEVKYIPNGKVVINTHKVVHLAHYFKDPQGDKITYSVRGSNSNVGRSIIDGDKLQLEGLRLGETNITVYADDGNGHISSGTFKIEVVPAPVDPPYYKVQGVLYGPDFMELEWYPILGAAGYWIFLNGELMFDQPEDGSYFYHYRAEGLDPSLDNVLELLPYDGDGQPIGEGTVYPFPPSDGLETFSVNADVVENDVTVKWDVGELIPTAYKVAIKDENGNVVDSKEYNYAGATQHVAKIEKAGVYTASVSPKVQGEYLGAQATEFVIEQDYIENKAPMAIGNGLENIRVTVGETPIVKNLNAVFSDPEGGELTYSIRLTNTNASAVIEGSQLTVVGNVPGMTSATVTVQDEEGATFTQNVIIYIEKAVNKAPVVDTQIEDKELAITDAPLTFNAAEHFSDPEDGTVVVTIGTLSNSNIEVTTNGTDVTITPKKVGTTTVQLVGNDSEGETVKTSFTVTVKEVAPVSPTNVTVTATAYNEVQVAFEKVSNATNYIIKRNGEVVKETTTNTFTDKNLTAETAYEYEVIAVNEVGQSEPGVASVTTPEMPQVENLTADVTEQTVVLNWDEFAGSDNRYKVYRYIESADGTLTLDNYGQTVYENTFTDTKLQGETKYQYKVVPYVTSQTKFVEEFNATVDIETEEINLAPVASSTIPSQTLKEDDAPKVLDLTSFFSDPNNDALTYEVVNVSRANVKVTLDGSNLTITPNAVGKGEVTLKVTDPKGLSVEQTFVVDVISAAPTAVKNLKLEAVSYSSVQVTFDASEKADSYIIKRDGVEIKRTTETTFTDTGLTADTTYNYEVIAVNKSGEAVTEGDVTTPEMPVVQNIKAEATASDKAKITWDAYGDSKRYRVIVFSKDENGNFVQEGYGRTTSATQLEYTPLEAGKEYYFGVIPFIGSQPNEDLMGVSNTINTPEPPAPAAPENVQFDVTLDGLKANLTITPLVVNGTTITQYRLSVHEKLENGDYKQIGNLRTVSNEAELTQIYEGLEAGKTYKFTVQPRVNFSYSKAEYHNTKEITVAGEVATTPTEPEDEVIVPEVVVIKDVNVSLDASNNATVTWEGFGEATQFKVWRYVVNEDGSHTRDNYGIRVNGNSFVDPAKLAANTDYLYVIVPLAGNKYSSALAKGGTATTNDGTNSGPVASVDTVSNIQYTKVGNNVSITWDRYKDVTRYRIEVQYLAADGNWKVHRSATTSTGLSTSIALRAGFENKIVVKPLVNGNYTNEFFGETESFSH